MDSFLIRGGSNIRLKGKIEISGSKNSALPILAACLLAGGKTTLRGVPRLSDIDLLAKLIGGVGFHGYPGCPCNRPEPADPPRDGVPGQPPRPALNGPLDIEVIDQSKIEARYDI